MTDRSTPGEWRARAQRAAAIALVLLVPGASRPQLVAAQSIASQHEVRDSAGLRELFRAEHYSLARVRQTGLVPPIFSRNLPDDLGALAIDDYEHLFIRIMLPAVLAANAAIRSDRARLSQIVGRPPDAPIGPTDAAWLLEIASRYGGTAADPVGLVDRVDIVPASLVIAQAIDESGWGRSRVAIEGNCLFGQHAPGNAASRSTRASDANVSLAVFDSIRAAVAAHTHDLNSSHGYAELRAERARLRAAGRRPRGSKLVASLGGSSEQGRTYVDTLKSIMRHHHLADFDTAALDTERRPMEVRLLPAPIRK